MEITLTQSSPNKYEDTLFTYLCTLGNNKIEITTLMDTCAKGGNFIHYKTARRICEAENLKLKTLRKAIQVEGFNRQKAPAITHKLSVSLQIGKHYQPECNFLVTDLGKNDMIIGNKWMADHGAIPVPKLQDVWFIGGHCRHEGAPPPLAPPRKPSIISRPQQHIKETGDSDSLDKSPDLQNNTEQEKQPPKIEIVAVSAQAFFKLAQRPEAMVMAVSMRDIMDQHEKDKVRNDDPLEFIPKKHLQKILDGSVWLCAALSALSCPEPV